MLYNWSWLLAAIFEGSTILKSYWGTLWKPYWIFTIVQLSNSTFKCLNLINLQNIRLDMKIQVQWNLRSRTSLVTKKKQSTNKFSRKKKPVSVNVGWQTGNIGISCGVGFASYTSLFEFAVPFSWIQYMYSKIELSFLLYFIWLVLWLSFWCVRFNDFHCHCA